MSDISPRDYFEGLINRIRSVRADDATGGEMNFESAIDLACSMVENTAAGIGAVRDGCVDGH